MTHIGSRLRMLQGVPTWGFSSTAMERIRKIRRVGTYPSGQTVVGEWIPMLQDVAQRAPACFGALNGGDKSSLQTGCAIATKWAECGSPIWWVNAETAADLIQTPLPKNMTYSDVPWPFPAFALVFEGTMAICAFPATSAIDGNGETLDYTGILHHVGIMLDPMRKPISYTESSGNIGDFTLSDRGIDQVKFVRLIVGSALLLSSHSSEELKPIFPSSGKNKIHFDNSGEIEPPWLHEAAKRKHKAMQGNGSHASPEAHWRRAHWRLQRVGTNRLDRKMTWVRHTLVNEVNS